MLVRIQRFALIVAAALFVCCVAIVAFAPGGLLVHGALTKWLTAAGSVLLAYASGQPKITRFSTLSFGNYVPAIAAYWTLAVVWTGDITLATSDAYMRPQAGAFAGAEPVINLAVGCALVAIAIVLAIVGWFRLRPSIHRVDTIA
jgi:hypothetical protein